MIENEKQRPSESASGDVDEGAATAPAGDSEPAARDTAATPTPDERIAALETEKTEARDRMLRIAAEFENWKKRSRREQQECEIKGKEAVLKDMFEVLDNLERATAAWGENTDSKGVQQGVQLVLRLFQSKLERHDVRPIEAKGQPFDPRMHDAISQVPTTDVSPGVVISELQKGYRMGDRLLRPATVIVAIAPPLSPAAPDGAGAIDGTGGDSVAKPDDAH